jgi:hypothetical protein
MAKIEGARYRLGASEGDTAGWGPFLNAGAPVNGTTFDEIAEKGALLIDTTNGKLYINTGTKSSSVWTVVGAQT